MQPSFQWSQFVKKSKKYFSNLLQIQSQKGKILKTLRQNNAVLRRAALSERKQRGDRARYRVFSVQPEVSSQEKVLSSRHLISVLNSWNLKIGRFGQHRYLVQRWKILQFAAHSQIVAR
jgi:hypothetical protein